MLNCLIPFNTSAFRATAFACLRLSHLPSSLDFFRARFLTRSTFPPSPSLLFSFLTSTLYSGSLTLSLSIDRTFHLLEDGPKDSKKGGSTRTSAHFRRDRPVHSRWGRRPRYAGPSWQKEITGIISEWLIDACRTSYACALALPSLPRSR